MVSLQLDSAGMTDRGKTRAANEDTILNYTRCEESGENFGLYIVCDGLGGHQAGDVASQTAVRTVVQELQSILPPSPTHHLTTSADINHVIWTAVQKANEAIWQQAEKADGPGRGMGTTLTMAVVINDTVHIAHVGDSRLYLFREGQLEQLTRDHTMAAALAEVGQISEDEIADHPRQNILTRALGRKNSIVEAELMELPFLPGDTLLLCSDGLWKAFKGKKAKLEEMLQGMKNMHHTCRQLLMEANELDGSDNISLIIVSARSPRPSFQQRFTGQTQRQVREAVAV